MEIMLPFTWARGGEATPNAKGDFSSNPLTTYFICITTTMASFRRWNPGARLVLVTDAVPPSPFARELFDLQVEVLLTDFDHEPPDRFAPAFRTSMFMLDALQAASVEDDRSHLAVIDPDMLCMESLDRTAQAVDDEVGALAIDYHADHDINGLTRREATKIHRTLDGSSPPVATHYGGEFIVIPRARLGGLLSRTQVAWVDAVRRFEAGEKHFVTEEHIMSYALAAMPVRDLSPLVRRIWTAPSYRSVEGDERALALWHLPAEKRRGFPTLHKMAMDPGSWWWTGDHERFVREVGSIVGIPTRDAPRYVYDVTRGVAARAKRAGKKLARRRTTTRRCGNPDPPR